MNWSTHIEAVTKKVNNSLAFLRRNIYQCPRQTKVMCYMLYTTLVRPQMEYASMIWDPRNMTNIIRLERIQRRAARFVTENYHK